MWYSSWKLGLPLAGILAVMNAILSETQEVSRLLDHANDD
ncbi:cytochrome bd-I oxidase subunit CydX [Amaricoccus macauensis]